MQLTLIKQWMVMLVVCVLASTANAQDLGFDYIVQRGEQSITMFGEREFVGNARSEYLIKGWNPSGRYFMNYYVNPDDQSVMLFLNDYTVPEAFPIFNETIISYNYPTYFGDERLLFIELVQDILVSEDEQGIGILRVNLYEWMINGSQSDINLIGTIPYGIGCGGSGVRSTLDHVYSLEVKGDTFGEYNRDILAPTPYGIVHTNSCTAIRTYLTDPATTEFVELSDNLRWATVSPDGNWVAGTSGNQLQLIDLKTLDITVIAEPDAPVYSITWAADSSVFYYVARATDGEFLPFDDPNNALGSLDPVYEVVNPKAKDLIHWESSINRYALAVGKSSEIYRADAYAIGNMTWVDDTLVFNQIGQPTAWLQAIIDGNDGLDRSLIPVTLIQLDTQNGDATELGDDFRGIWVRPR